MLAAPKATYTNNQYELNIPERKIDETEKNKVGPCWSSFLKARVLERKNKA